MPSKKTEGAAPKGRSSSDSSTLQPWPGALLASVLLMACHAGVAGRVAPGYYAQSFDSASSSCRTNPALCARVAGEETIVPQAGQRLAEFSASVTAAALVLSAEHRRNIEEKLALCANEARTTVLLQHMQGRSPTPEECREVKEFGGRVRTRAMFFGEEMHRLALQCAQRELNVLHPGGFSIEPRYRYNKNTGQRELISPEREEALLEEGCYNELRGTIKPDIVIHSGNPLTPQAVYDFKFPCVNNDSVPWCRYTKGPHQGRWQNDVYHEALGIQPRPILPRTGVMP
jgi:hypothetical protein